jgi:hypothetical protein
LGGVRSLPRVTGASPALVVELHPDTGGLKSVRVSNDVADIPGIIGSVNTGTAALLTAAATKREKELAAEQEAAAKLDPLAVLTREQALLEAELAIELAKEALKQSTQ